MPTSVFFNGQQQYRPGVYLQVVDATTAPTSLSAGNIAIIGEFPVLEQAKIHTFAQSETMREFFFPVGANGQRLSDETLLTMQRVSSIVWGGYTVPTDLGRIDSINVISVTPSTAASHTASGLKIESRFWGTIGNALKVQLEADPSDATKWKLSVKRGTTVLEEFSDIGDDDYATIYFLNSVSPPSTGALSDAFIEVSQSALSDTDGDGVLGSEGDYRTGGSIAVRGEQTVAAATINALVNTTSPEENILWEPRSPFMGGATVSLSCVSAQSASSTFTVVGTAENGLALEEDLVFSSSAIAGETLTTTAVFKTVSNVYVDGNAAFTGNLEINFPIKVSSLNDVPSVETFLNDVVGLDDRFVVDAPGVPVAGYMLDKLSSVSCFTLAAKKSLKTDLFRIYSRALSASQFVKTTLVSNVLPAVFDEYLSGGGISDDPNASDWQDALDALLYENINLVVPMTPTFEIHELVKDHCKRAATESGLERAAWIGTSKGLSLQNVNLQWVKMLNDPNIAVVFQGMQHRDSTVMEEPYWLALSLAVMQARTPIAEPLTRKRLSKDVVRTFSGAVNPNADANEAIRKGIVIVNGRAAPYRVERSVTSYLTQQDHPVFCEVSSVESINVSVRDVRQFLEEVIGGKATESKLNDVLKIVEDRLTLQRNRGIIESFQDAAVSLVGDRINVSYAVRAQKPLNFIVVTTFIGG